MQPLITVIVPVYNGEKVISRCVDSILKQSYANIQIIIVNDGSTDGTREILEKLTDSRILLINQENSGVSASRNAALDRAEGKYVQFLDADDYITPDATFLLADRAESTGADLVVSDFYRVVKDRVSRKGDIATDRLLTVQEYAGYMLDRPADYYYGVLWNKLYKTRILNENHIRMDAEMSFCEDFMFNLEYLRRAKTVAALRVPLYYYIKTEGSLVSKNVNLASIQNILNMKRSIFTHYQDFYRDVLPRQDYEAVKLQVYKFLIEAGRDGIVPPVFSEKLGEERVTIDRELAAGDDLLSTLYLYRKALESFIQPISIQYGISNEAARVLYAVTCGIDGRKALRDLLDYNPVKLEMIISQLSLKGLVGESLNEDRVDAERSKRLQDNLLFAMENVFYKSLSREEKAEYLRLRGKINENIRDFLGRSDELPRQ